MNMHQPRMLRRIAISIGSIVFVFSILLITRWALQFFTIKEILMSGDPAHVEINKEVFVGNILFFKTHAIEKEIQEHNPLVDSVRIIKKLPSTIEIVVYKRLPVALLISQGNAYEIAAQAIILGDATTRSLPQIIVDVPVVRVGAKITDPVVIQALAFIENTRSYLTVMQIIKKDSSSIQVETRETNIIITQKQDMQSILDTLQILIEGFRIKGSMPKTVDLRFGKPIVQ